MTYSWVVLGLLLFQTIVFHVEEGQGGHGLLRAVIFCGIVLPFLELVLGAVAYVRVLDEGPDYVFLRNVEQVCCRGVACVRVSLPTQRGAVVLPWGGIGSREHVRGHYH